MRRLILLAGVLALAACRSGEPDSGAELTKRQTDSAIGVSGLPGAQGVTRAMNAADSSATRNARMDSAAMEP